MTESLQSADVDSLLSRLSVANQLFDAQFPGLQVSRQPIHTVYGGANLYGAGTGAKISSLAVKHFQTFAPEYTAMAKNLGLDADPTEVRQYGSHAWIAKTVFDRVTAKLATQAIEDHRVDFEDGYGSRSDEQEDGHAMSASSAMAEAFLAGHLPPFVGIRIKALSEEAKVRSLRTLDLFVTRLVTSTQGKLPQSFTVTLPKVISPTQVEVLHAFLTLLEHKLLLRAGCIRIELMLENVQSLFDADGRLAMPAMVKAGNGRVTGFVLGTFDYTATCNVASTFQSHTHASVDFARQMMLASLMGTDVAIIDGITNIMPIAPHKGDLLSESQREENKRVVADAWKLHFDNIQHSLERGIYQGWDLNPAQIPVRFAAVYYFFLTGLEASSERLRTFIDKAAQASMVGNTFDDAATGQGLVNFFVNGVACGAITETEALQTGLTLDELRGRSFLKIIENRVNKS